MSQGKAVAIAPNYIPVVTTSQRVRYERGPVAQAARTPGSVDRRPEAAIATVAGGFGSDLAEELVVGMRDRSFWPESFLLVLPNPLPRSVFRE